MGILFFSFLLRFRCTSTSKKIKIKKAFLIDRDHWRKHCGDAEKLCYDSRLGKSLFQSGPVPSHFTNWTKLSQFQSAARKFLLRSIRAINQQKQH